MHTEFDHAVVACNSLESGTKWLESKLGVPLSVGGEHARMGTHNRLLRLGDSQYLELIAIQPGTQIKGPRWFGLDNPWFQRQLQGGPRLAAWVARTGSIEVAVKAFPDTLGPIQAMSRNTLNWFITVPESGDVPQSGALPLLIEWLGNRHPTQNLPHRGCRLRALEIHTPAASRIGTALKDIGYTSPGSRFRILETQRPSHFRLCIDSPLGTVRFDSAGASDGERLLAAEQAGRGAMRKAQG